MAALADLAIAFGLVFVAELGDKTQLLIAAQAARSDARRVLAEAAAAFAILTAVAVAAGAWLSDLVPAMWVAVAAGLLFLVFAALSLRDAADEDLQEPRVRPGSTFALLLVAELGDKTQLATAALAASGANPLAAGLGAWVALVASALLAVLAGGWVAARVGPRRRALLAGVVFAIAGIATLALGIVQR